MTGRHICELTGIRRSYRVRQGFFSRNFSEVRALDNVSLAIGRNEIVGLVGESGCGKTTLARIALGLETADTGTVRFDGKDISSLDGKGTREFRRRSQMVFQDPFSSLNPKKTIYSTLAEPLVVHGICAGKQVKGMVERLLDDVGLDMDASGRYPHEFSGGQRQRIGIARALATSPDFIVADEPTSALDVSIQAQIINLLLTIQEDRKFSVLFISHDLPLVRFVSHRIAVMYRGQVVEVMNSDGFSFENSGSMHPYTRCLLESALVPDVERSRKHADRECMKVEEPVSFAAEKGCAFASRCPEAIGICHKKRPVLMGHDGHFLACHNIRPA